MFIAFLIVILHVRVGYENLEMHMVYFFMWGWGSERLYLKVVRGYIWKWWEEKNCMIFCCHVKVK